MIVPEQQLAIEQDHTNDKHPNQDSRDHRRLQNAVAPGIIKTPIHGRTREQFEDLNGMQPLGHVGEVGDVVLYLADAEFVTGVVLPVDGGVHAGGQ